MGAGTMTVIGLRIIALIAALVVVGLGAWCKGARFDHVCNVLTILIAKFIIHDVEIRGGAVLQRLQPEALTAQQWRDFFTAATTGTTRIWIAIVGVGISPIFAKWKA
jgi:hypothetical protein